MGREGTSSLQERLVARPGTINRTVPGVLLLLAALTLWPRPGVAVEYSNPIEVNDEDDIYQLYENQIIEVDERDRLLDLLREPVDLNEASRDELYELPGLSYKLVDRILRYRRKHGDFKAPGKLRKVRGITKEIWAQVHAFVEAGTPLAWLDDVSGRVRVRANGVDTRNLGDAPDTDANPDDPLPAFVQQADLKIMKDYAVGWTFIQDRHLAPVNFVPWDGNEPGYFLSDGQSYSPRLGNFKAYGTARLGSWDIIVGHYRVGFGQGLTFDNTGRISPFGWRTDNSVYESYMSTGYSMPRGQRGLAITGEDFRLARGLIADVSAFVSYSDEDLYQYDFGYHELEDPDEFSSYRLYEGSRDEDELNKLSYQTLPNIYHELVGGGHVRLTYKDRHHLGVTGYGGKILWSHGDDVDFQMSDAAPFPEDRQSFGAFGLDAGTGIGPWSVFGEVAMTDAGSSAVYLRSLLEFDRVDVDLSARNYATDYDNPHSRGKAAADEYDGNRDRDERGTRLLVSAKLPWTIRLRGSVDLWQRMSQDLWNIEAYVRADAKPLKWLKLSLYLYQKDKDIGRSGREQSYDSSGDDPGGGQKTDWAAQVSVKPIKGLMFTGYYKRTLKDASVYIDAYEPTQYYWFMGSWSFMKGWRVASRFKVYDEDTLDESRGDRYWEIYGELEARLVGRLSTKLRYTYQRGNKTLYKTIDGESYAYADMPVLHHLKAALDFRF